jgi:hypothetical protein
MPVYGAPAAPRTGSRVAAGSWNFAGNSPGAHRAYTATTKAKVKPSPRVMDTLGGVSGCWTQADAE